MLNLHKKLTPEEEVEYRAWARENWRTGSSINITWHPIVLDEIQKISIEALFGNRERLDELRLKIISVIQTYPEFNHKNLQQTLVAITQALYPEL